MKRSVLFVCLGNICRSPLAEGVFQALVAARGLSDELRIDSCGTGGWHAGESPDPRSVEVAASHGVFIDGQRSRQLSSEDYASFDWLVAMDRENERVIRSRMPSAATCRVVTLMSFHPGEAGADVPDPYYGGPGGFDEVYDLLDAAAPSLLEAVLEASG